MVTCMPPSKPPIVPSALPFLSENAENFKSRVRKNIESFIGFAKVPVGLAGPLLIRGEHASGEFWVPLATTEGTLVASTTRGMKVIHRSGGVEARVFRHGGIQRAPVLVFPTLDRAIAVASELQADWRWLCSVAETTTKHGRLVNVETFVFGRMVHVRCTMDSADAAGQNMVSVAVSRCIEVLVERYPDIERVWLEGGYSGEKVPSHLNMLMGRGRGVMASTKIPAAILEDITRAKATDIVELFMIYANSSLVTGTKNSHASLINILPAIYIATGQDVASVPESCMAQNVVKWHEQEQLLEWQVVCPNIVAGTVGGGTGLMTQRECLEMMGCYGDGKLDKFVEICAATALANEVSFWSAIAAQEWVRAHESLKKR
jgi:hydroxymethylglutaryl-CoA reductase (NADPH)